MLLLRYKKSICAILVIAALYCAFSYPVKKEYGYVCLNTASRKTHTTWVELFRASATYEKSPIEEYLESEKADWRHDWVSYNGTGKNIFGMSISWGHGRPGAVSEMHPEIFPFIRSLSDSQKEEIYSVLKSGNQEAIHLKIESIYNRMLK